MEQYLSKKKLFESFNKINQKAILELFIYSLKTMRKLITILFFSWACSINAQDTVRLHWRYTGRT